MYVQMDWKLKAEDSEWSGSGAVQIEVSSYVEGRILQGE